MSVSAPDTSRGRNGRPFQRQVLLWMSSVTLLTCLVASLLLLRLDAEGEREQAEAWMQATAIQLAAQFGSEEDGPVAEVDAARGRLRDALVALDRELATRPNWPAASDVLYGTSLVGSNPSGELLVIASAPDGEFTADEIVRGLELPPAGTRMVRNARGGPRVIAPVADADGRVWGAVIVDARMRYFAGIWREATLEAGLLLALGVALCLAAATFFARSMAAPLRDLHRSMAGLAAGDLSTRARGETGPAELRALAAGFNGMADGLASAASLARQIDLAAAVQARLLPVRAGALGQIEYASDIRFSEDLGGDLIEVMEHEGAVIVLVADVVGHGFAASLLAAQVQASFWTAVIGSKGRIDTALSLTSRQLFRRQSHGAFATAFAAAVIPREGTVRWCSAGHEVAMVLGSDGPIRELAATGIPLGIDPDSTWPIREAEFVPGDRLIVTTDGVRERRNAAGAFYGSTLLRDSILRTRHMSAPDSVSELLGAVEEFAGESRPTDDATLLVLRRSGSEGS